ncbi:hypothetical protein JCGZ_09769 [Jatropha curcas]|uniref:FAD-binding PCMH-type domain-containing protein n=1 Tax=Jatropha curcas TaxID=180498 RepID=A0A067KWX9_JATCU|nr:hypothetical protein JCGZ_09769 [Jatropha curcas]
MISSKLLPFLFAVFLFSFSWVTTTSAHTHEDFLECLKLQSEDSSSISKVIYTPINSSYLSVLQLGINNERFNTSTTPKPQVIVTPLNLSHIEATITCSKKHDLQIRIRSGGHDYEGLSYVSPNPFVILDLITLQSITVDATNKTAWVQVGATTGKLYYSIAEKSQNLAFPASVCTTVGIGGHFSGGGYGTLLRKYGLAADNIIDAQLTDVDGLTKEDSTEMSWIESVLYFAGFSNSSLEILLERTQQNVRYFKAKSDYVQQPMPEVALEGIWKRLFEVEVGSGQLMFNLYGGRVSEISESSIPFPHRAGNLYKIQHSVYWNDEGIEESITHISWIRRLYSFLAPYVSKNPRSAYINYRDLDIGINNIGNTSYEQASIWGIKYFKINFDRLVHVKTQVDPANFFRNEQSIPSLPYWWS